MTNQEKQQKWDEIVSKIDELGDELEQLAENVSFDDDVDDYLINFSHAVSDLRDVDFGN